MEGKKEKGSPGAVGGDEKGEKKEKGKKKKLLKEIANDEASAVCMKYI